MGTDIHFAVEVLDEDFGWTHLPAPPEECRFCRGTGVNVKEAEPCRWCATEDAWSGIGRPGWVSRRWYENRNYTVFAVLGNVRNGSGFAGVYTHDPIKPISNNRGVPDDATPATLMALSNEHSATWMALAEVEAYDWDQDMIRGGVITLEQYAECQRTGDDPHEWSGGISGPNIQVITPLEAERMLADGVKNDDERPTIYVHYRWISSLREHVTDFLLQMGVLRGVVDNRPCRLIMDFDS